MKVIPWPMNGTLAILLNEFYYEIDTSFKSINCMLQLTYAIHFASSAAHNSDEKEKWWRPT